MMNIQKQILMKTTIIFKRRDIFVLSAEYPHTLLKVLEYSHVSTHINPLKYINSNKGCMSNNI